MKKIETTLRLLEKVTAKSKLAKANLERLGDSFFSLCQCSFVLERKKAGGWRKTKTHLGWDESLGRGLSGFGLGFGFGLFQTIKSKHII